MRIVILLNSLFTGGAEFSTLAFYGWLQKKNYDIRVVVLKEVNPAYDPKRFGFDSVSVLEGNSWISKWKSFNKLIREFKPSLVHSVLFEANLIARLSRIYHRNFFHLESLVNEMYSEHRYADPQVTRTKLFSYRLIDFVTQFFGVDHFHANGNSVSKHYQEKLKINQKRITVIQRGRESNPFYKDLVNRERVRKELATSTWQLIINMARHEYQKGQDVLLDAMQLLKEDKNKIQLVIIGREGKLTSVLEDKIDKFHLKDSVLLLGHRDDATSLLAAADVFVFPSRFEGLPGALIEAEAAGLPIVCSDIPNNREVANDRNAIFFPVGQADNLANAIKSVINHHEKRNLMGNESVRLFRENFLLEDIHVKMEELIKSLIHQSQLQ